MSEQDHELAWVIEEIVESITPDKAMQAIIRDGARRLAVWIIECERTRHRESRQ